WGGITGSTEIPKFNRKDALVLGAIVLLYSAIALTNLGKTSAPVTHWDQTEENGGQILLDFGSEKQIYMIHTFLGNYEDRLFMAEVSHDGQNFEQIGEVKAGSVFTWNEMAKTEAGDVNGEVGYNLANKYRYLRLTSQNTESVLMELVIKDSQNATLTPVNKDDYPELFDEQNLYMDQTTFMEGTYFDEIYHARTAYEMTQGIYNYENTHPPLGKFIISLGIRIFGMNPFGWRIMGTLFGIGMLPFMYLFGRRLFRGKTWAAGALTFLFAFDFMHFTQTRIATIDVYGTFFIIAMYYFMYCYGQTSFYDRPLNKTFIPLGLSAIMMGLGCASKWTAVYAAAGLGLYFFYIMGRRYYEYRLALKKPEGQTLGIEHSHIIKVFRGNLIKTLLFCILFFVLVAGAIYLCSYIPFSDGCNNNFDRFNYQLTDTNEPVTGLYRTIAESLQDSKGAFSELLGKCVKNAHTMYTYHSQLKATHPYSSTWYEWPGMYRPMFYYCETLSNGLKEGISAFGNPLVWWAGIPAFIYMLWRIFSKKDRLAAFVSFAYLVQYVPWMLVPRCTFAYHYFPSVPFVCMMIVYIMVRLREKNEKWFKWILIYLAIAFLLFVLFYPVLSGAPVSDTYVRDGLRWREGWVLVY
nr:glycosyltransferase family 39 protein [Eubacterium sp.]